MRRLSIHFSILQIIGGRFGHGQSFWEDKLHLGKLQVLKVLGNLQPETWHWPQAGTGTQDPQAHWAACPKVTVTGTWVSGSCSSSSGLHELHLHSRGQYSAFWTSNVSFLRESWWGNDMHAANWEPCNNGVAKF